MAYLARVLPLSNDRTVFLYYVYCILYGLYPVNAIVGLFFLFKGLSFAEIGIVFTVFSLAGFLFEVPTGYIADKYGRRTSILIGLVILSCASFLWVSAEHYMHFAALAALWMVGFTCISGSFEAYIFDHLAAGQATEHYDAVLSASAMLWYYSGALGAVLGAFLFSLEPTFPYLLLSLLFAAMAAVVLRMDADVRHSGRTEAPLSLFSGLAHIRASPSLLWITVFVACFWGYHEFFISSTNSPYIMSLGVFDVAYLGVFMAASSLMKGYVSAHFATLRLNLSDAQLLVGLSVVQVASLIGMGLLTGVPGLIAVFIFMQLFAFENIVRNSFAQKYITSESRATTLSTMNVVSAVAASATGIGAGALIDYVGLHASFLWVGLGMAVVLSSLIVLRVQLKISL